MEPFRPGDGRQRRAIRVGDTVEIVEKQNQRSGRRTKGVVTELLTSSPFHPHGIKVRLRGGAVGRVQAIVGREGD